MSAQRTPADEPCDAYEQAIRDLVAAAPPLTDDQRTTILRALHGGPR